MRRKYDKWKFGERLKDRIKVKYLEDSEKYSYCKNQEIFAEKMNIDRRTLSSWQNSSTYPTIEQLLTICELLECDADYLLGMNDEPLKTEREISEKTGISQKVLANVGYDEKLLKALNYFFDTEEMFSVIQKIHKNCLSEYKTEDFLNGFSDKLLGKIEAIHHKFDWEILPTEKTEDKYAEYLKKGIPYDKVKSTLDEPKKFELYLKKHLCEDKLNYIEIEMENKNCSDEKSKYDTFIEMMVVFTYRELEYKLSKELEMKRISQTLERMVSNYIEYEIRRMRGYIK